MSIKRYDIEAASRYAFINECESEEGCYVRYKDHAAEVARLNEQLEAAEAQVKELTANLDKESEIRHRIHEELIKLKDKQKLLLVNGSIKTDGFWGRMAAKESVRANKAEARITEQGAVIDQRNAECVRLINEKATLEAKLTEIKGGQQPIGAFHISGGEVEATSDYIKPGEWPVNDGIVEVYAHPAPSVLPPERPANSSNGDDISAWIDEGYNQAIADARALGAKPLPVVDMRHIAHSTIQISGQRYTYLHKEDVLHTFKELGIRIRNQDSDPVEGIEIKL